MNITINRHNDPAYEFMLDSLIQEVFGISFALWFERGLWGNNYESYSIIEDGKMLSNVCIYKAELLVCGEKVTANQFGAVATSKSARGKGLSRILMEHVLSLYPDTLAYLAANSSVINFYPQFGFRQIQTYKAGHFVNINNDSTKAIKCKADNEIVTQAINSRNMYSNLVDCTNSESIQIFHLIMSYPDDIYYLPGCKAVVVSTKKDGKLFLADVVAQNPITFAELALELPFDGINVVEFGFNPDWLGIAANWQPASLKHEPFFIKGNWKLPEKFRFPITSET